MATLREVFPKHLRTERLTLELFDYSDEHYQCLIATMNTTVALNTMGDYNIHSPADFDKMNAESRLRSDRFASGIADGDCYYLMRLGPDSDDGELIGAVSLCQHTIGPKLLPPDLGWCLLEPHMGKGYTTEAARALREDAMKHRGFHDFVVLADGTNAASNRVAAKLGFVHAGDVPDPDRPGEEIIRLLVPPGTEHQYDFEAMASKAKP